MTMIIKPTFSTPDGKSFDTRAEALNHMRRPEQLKVLTPLCGQEKLAEWLIDKSEDIEAAFESGTVRRVKNSERKKLDKALEAVVKLFGEGNRDLSFLADNAEAAGNSFRWPSVKRLTDAEKAIAANDALMILTENNADLVAWIIEKKEDILAGYQAGVEKRQISEKALTGLANFRAKKAAEKAAEEANAGTTDGAPAVDGAVVDSVDGGADVAAGTVAE
jgi:hypothetical protein